MYTQRGHGVYTARYLRQNKKVRAGRLVVLDTANRLTLTRTLFQPEGDQSLGAMVALMSFRRVANRFQRGQEVKCTASRFARKGRSPWGERIPKLCQGGCQRERVIFL